jgi:two-component system C4-dicarboxylate transport response regulator DctD
MLDLGNAFSRDLMKVLYVEDDPSVRRGSKQALELAGMRVDDFESAERAIRQIRPGAAAVVVTDVRMPGMDGLELLRRIKAIDASLPVVIVTGHGDIAMAVGAMRDGAYEFIEKPFSSERLCEVVQRAMQTRSLGLEVLNLRRKLDGQQSIEAMLIGNSAAIDRLRRQVVGLADTDADVLIHGETGTGKELVARALHQLGARHAASFVALNCGGLPESLFEAEIFGHEVGAFTSASKRRIGKLEHARGGTLFLDEIETMPMPLQVKMLRVLEERAFERLGSNDLIAMDARVLSATKADLRQLADDGRFRADLYYRLGVVILEVPALRERCEDIPLLFEHFVLQAGARYGRVAEPLQRHEMNRLMSHSWPGNVRELRNVAHRHVLGISSTTDTEAGAARGRNFEEQVAAFERHLLEESLRASGGHASVASEMLGLPRKTLYDKLRRHGLAPEDFR